MNKCNKITATENVFSKLTTIQRMDSAVMMQVLHTNSLSCSTVINRVRGGSFLLPLTKTSSPSNPVHVGLPILRHIQVDHQVDFLSIYTPGRLSQRRTENKRQVGTTRNALEKMQTENLMLNNLAESC